MVSKGIRKKDSGALLSGKPVYTEDLIHHRDVLTIKILRSPHAFARIKSIKTDVAKKVKGVVDIYTYEDVPQNRYTISGESYPEASPYDQLILERTLRYVGDEVAIIAAEDEISAQKAMKLIKVEYELLEPVLDFTKAEGHKSIVHEEEVHCPFDFGLDASKNIVSTHEFGKGDIEEAFGSSDVVMERSYTTQAQAHAMMETHRAYSYIDLHGRLVVISSNQSAYHMRRQISRSVGIPLSKIRVIKPRIGGGFGGKNIAVTEPHVSFVTWKTKRPAKLILTRKETFAATNTRHPMKLDLKVGSDRQGNIKAIHMKVLNNTGAYGDNGPAVTMEAGHNVLPIYNDIEAIKYEGKTVYTNLVPAGALRGYGATQGAFALDSIINELAIELGMDPVEIKLKNSIEKGAQGGVLRNSIKSCNLRGCIERGKELIGWDEKYPSIQISPTKARGVGMAVAIHGSGIPGIDCATVSIRMVEDGTYKLLTGSSDLGTGSDTILAQIAAEVLCTDANSVSVYSGDTDVCPYDTGAYASCTTYVTGNATVRAAEKLKESIILAAEKNLSVPSAHLTLKKDRVCHIDDEEVFVTLDTLGCESVCGPESEVLMEKASFGIDESPRPFIAGFAEVEVDKTTGEVKVVNYAAVADCGTVINPNLARIQVEGGITQGIGLALFEDVKNTESGRLITDNFLQYKVPCKKDIGEIMVDFKTDYEPTGPFGAKSIGEIVVHTPSPAIASAVYNAVGVHMRDLPITPEKVYMKMKRK